jgi:hypothetical protein
MAQNNLRSLTRAGTISRLQAEPGAEHTAAQSKAATP